MKALPLALLLLGGCEACAPPPPPVVHPIPGPRLVVAATPGTALRLVWAAVGECVGRVERIDDWSFYIVAGGQWPSGDPRWDYLAATWRELHRIYVADAVMQDLGVLRHEILHAHGIEHAPIFAVCGAYPWPSEVWRGRP